MFPYRQAFISVLWFVTVAVHAQDTSQHTVMRGETFTSIAKKYGITEDQLKKANSRHQTCYVGLKLTVPIASASSNKNNSETNPEQPAATANNSPGTQSQFAAANNDMGKNDKKKKKKSFWKSLGNAMSAVGDIAILATEGLVETGLVSKEGTLGSGLAASADMANMLQGKDSNYSGYQSEGIIANENKSNTGSYTAQSANDIAGMERRIEAINIRIEQIENELAGLLQESNKNKQGQYGAAKKSMTNQRKYQNVNNNSVTQRNRAINASIKAQQPYTNKNNEVSRRRTSLNKERKELFAERKRLRQQINSMTGASQDYNDSSDNYHTTSKTKVTCDACNGKGKNPHGKMLAVPSSNSMTVCNQCSLNEPHVHETCIRCKGKGYIMR